MKVIGIVGSPRGNGNTEFFTAHTLKAISEEGLDTELVRLAGLDIKPCNACMACREEEACPIEDDLFPIYLKMKEADGIILASPVYFGSATALIKALMERVGYLSGPMVDPSAARWGGHWWWHDGPVRTSRSLSLRSGFRFWGSLFPVQPTGMWLSAGTRAT